MCCSIVAPKGKHGKVEAGPNPLRNNVAIIAPAHQLYQDRALITDKEV